MQQIIDNVKIIGTGSYTPKKIVTNVELELKGISNAQWVKDNLGISERHIAEPNEYTSDLATVAGREAMMMAGLCSDEIDLIIVATATPDYQAPSCASIVQYKLGCDNAVAFDVNAVCAGFLYAFSVATDLVSIGTYKNALVIGADAFSKVTNWTDRNSVFFGDGAGAIVIKNTKYINYTSDYVDYPEFHPNIIYTKLHTYGGSLGFNIPVGSTFNMDTKDVYNSATKYIPITIKEVLELAHMTIDDISYMIPHQPSIRILQAVADSIGLDYNKIKVNMNKYANTSAGTIPILLDEVNRRGEIHEGDNILFAAIGSGWTVASTIVKW